MSLAKEYDMIKPALHLCGFLGIGSLAYSAGYTRAYILENEIRITVATELISIPGLPGWTGILAFFGMGLILIYLLAVTVTSP